MRKMSQESLAQQTDSSSATIGRLEADSEKTELGLVLRVVEVLGLRFDPATGNVALPDDIDPRTVRRILDSPRRGPKGKLNCEVGKSAEQFLHDRGLKPGNKTKSRETGSIQERPAPEPTRVPLHRAGASASIKDLREEESDREFIDVPAGMQVDMAIVIKGQCQEPEFRDGQTVLISIRRWQSEGFVDREDYWIRFGGGESTFKRVKRDPNDDTVIVCWPRNEKNKPWKVKRSAIALAGRAVGVLF